MKRWASHDLRIDIVEYQLILVHALDMASNVHFLFSPIMTVGALKLRLLTAFPLLMVSQTALQLVGPPAVLAREIRHVLVGVLLVVPDDRRDAPGVPGSLAL